ncbi:MAG: META domain-containing protein [Chitinophagaceae bacterium]|nr:META domain-containing protein [Chitinophagaceae bacterium]
MIILHHEKKGNTNQSVSLYENKWSLKKIHTGNTVPDIQSKAFISFDQEKKRVGGNGGCNSFGGSLIVMNDLINISTIFSQKCFVKKHSKLKMLSSNNWKK